MVYTFKKLGKFSHICIVDSTHGGWLKIPAASRKDVKRAFSKSLPNLLRRGFKGGTPLTLNILKDAVRMPLWPSVPGADPALVADQFLIPVMPVRNMSPVAEQLQAIVSFKERDFVPKYGSALPDVLCPNSSGKLDAAVQKVLAAENAVLEEKALTLLSKSTSS